MSEVRKYSILILMVLSCISAVLQAQVLPNDSLALVDLYNATNGSAWTTKTNWLVAGRPVHTWFGVTRTNNRVTSLTLPTNNVEGSLPATIGNLAALTQLDLRNNKISGSLPSEVGNLVNLQFLYLYANQISGGIPASINNLVKIENLQLYSNQFSGSIPVIDKLTALKYLSLRNNMLTGPLPSSIGNLTNLEFLYLQSNQLSGIIPAEIGNLSNLKDLYLWGNQLQGNLPTTIGNLAKLLRLVVNKNILSGTIPVSIGNLSLLTLLDLRDNNMSGEIPTEIGNLLSLRDLLLGNDDTTNDGYQNQLTGSIPTSIGNLTSLSTFNAKNNSLSGSVPLEFTNLFSLQVIDVSANNFTSLPDLSSLPLITSFNTSNNFFTPEHLYPNISITGFVYAPQKTLDNNPVQAPSGDNYVISVDDNTPNNSYEWSLNGKPISPPVNSPTLLIQPLNRSTMGMYTCIITNVLLPGLTSSYSQKVEATATISGILKASETENALSGEMKLYKVTGSGAYELVRFIPSVNSTDGSYSFDNVVLDNYVLSGFANPINYLKAIPTWATNSIFWEEADTIFLYNDTTVNIISQYRPDPPTAGEGIIEGTFYEYIEFPDDGKINLKKRVGVEGAGVTVRRIQQSGRGAEEILDLKDYKFTDTEGEFVFTKLEAADYRLNIQYPGYPMDETSFITIPIGNTLFDRHVFIEAEVLNEKIYVRKLVITGWEDEQHTMQVYPNPTLAYLNISGNQDRSVKFTLTDAEGKSYQVFPVWNEADKNWSVDVQHLNPGAYILQMEQNSKVERLRILIQ